MNELIKLANEYYQRAGFIAGLSKKLLSFYTISIIALVISIILIVRMPMEKITLTDFITDWKGILYIVSLCSCFVIYGLIDRNKAKKIRQSTGTKKITIQEAKRDFFCELLICNESELLSYLEKYDKVYKTWREYSIKDQISFTPLFIKLSKFWAWIASTILVIYLNQQGNQIVNMIKTNSIIPIIIVGFLLTSVVGIFGAFIPTWLNGISRLIPSRLSPYSEAKIKFFLSDLSSVTCIKVTGIRPKIKI